jgi:hypothetical protein
VSGRELRPGLGPGVHGAVAATGLQWSRSRRCPRRHGRFLAAGD